MTEDLADPASRLRRYITGLSKALEEAEKNFTGGADARHVLEEVRRYLDDARYYYDKGDYITGLVAVSYAEGLLDALRLLGYTSFTWSRDLGEKTVLVGGTFDILHPGHVRFLREASRYGRLYVVVARDTNSEKFKGRQPINPEDWRLEVVSAVRYVYQALLGDERDPIKTIEKIRPDIVFLGPDQVFDEKEILRELRERGLEKTEVLRYRTRVGDYSSLGIIRKILSRYCPAECP